MDIKPALLKTIKAVNQEIKTFFIKNGTSREELGDFGKIFYKQLDQYLFDGGKRIRPFLTITAFEAVGGDHSEGKIIQAALSIELLHNGSLLHDDVIDKDETRRGRPSFHIIFKDFYKKKKSDTTTKALDFGEAMSIFAGDLCFPYAIESIIQSGFSEERRLRALNAFTQGFRDVIDGVIIETGDAILNIGNEETYKRMVNLKTGALIRKSAEIGAILGGGTESQIKSLIEYCNGLGVAFQIQDDILGIFGNPKELGKPVGGDIRENKQTILHIYSIKHGSSEQVKRINDLMGKEDLSQEELEEIRKIYIDTGSLENAKQLITKTTQESIKILDEAQPPLQEKPKKLLISLAKYLEQRKK